MGRVLEDDGSSRPFRCEFSGSTQFYREEEIMLAPVVAGVTTAGKVPYSLRSPQALRSPCTISGDFL